MGRGRGVTLCHVFQMFPIIQLKQVYTLWAHFINMSEVLYKTKQIRQVETSSGKKKKILRGKKEFLNLGGQESHKG